MSRQDAKATLSTGKEPLLSCEVAQISIAKYIPKSFFGNVIRTILICFINPFFTKVPCYLTRKELLIHKGEMDQSVEMIKLY